MAASSTAQAHVLRMKTDFSAQSIGDAADGGAPGTRIMGITGLLSWVGADGAATEEGAKRLIQILQEDPQGASLVSQAEQRAQKTIHEPFWKVITVCPAGTASSIMGQTDRGNPLVIREARDLEESTFDRLSDGSTNTTAANDYYRARIEQARAQDGIAADAPYNVSYFPDTFVIQTMNRAPAICLQRDLSVDEALAVLYHEMIHYIASDWSRRTELEKYSSESDYELQKVMSAGDEVDAYISQWSYQIRKDGKQAVPGIVRPFFSDDGIFIPTDPWGADNRQAIARIVLNGQIFSGGEGYHDLRFVSEYANELNYEEQSQLALYGFLQQIAQLRQASLAYYQQMFRMIPDQSSSEALKAMAVFQEDQRSIERLPQEEASCKARIDALGALVTRLPN